MIMYDFANSKTTTTLIFRKHFYFSKFSNKNTLHCLKAYWNRNKCFQNINVAAVFGLAHIPYLYCIYHSL